MRRQGIVKPYMRNIVIETRLTRTPAGAKVRRDGVMFRSINNAVECGLITESLCFMGLASKAFTSSVSYVIKTN